MEHQKLWIRWRRINVTGGVGLVAVEAESETAAFDLLPE
jgi:hypothetical protein